MCVWPSVCGLSCWPEWRSWGPAVEVAAARPPRRRPPRAWSCAVCHGQNAEGMPRLGKNLHNNAFVASQTDEALVQFLIEGRPATHPDNTRGVDMPPKGGNPALTNDNLQQIVVYLRSIQ